MAFIGNLPLQYVNLNICTLRFGFGGRVIWMMEGFLGCTLCIGLIMQGMCILIGSMSMGEVRRVMLLSGGAITIYAIIN